MSFKGCAISLRTSFEESSLVGTTSLVVVFSLAFDAKFETFFTFPESCFSVPCIYPSFCKKNFQMLKLFPQFQPQVDLYPLSLSSLYSLVAFFIVLGAKICKDCESSTIRVIDNK